MSDRERIVRHCTSPFKHQVSDILVNIKDTVSTLIMVYAGFRYSQRTVFTLCEPSYGVYMAICVGGIRLDLAAATVVIDTAIVAWPSKIAELLDPQTPIHEIQTPISSVNTWQRLLAACVERCRTWSHGPKCEYKSANGAPYLGSAEDNSLCSCGQGLGLESTGWKIAGWERLLPYSTRAAIPPLFGVVYLEEIVGLGLKLQNEPQPISWDEPEDECWECGEMSEDLIECSRCMKARYCSQDCRVKHWQAEHKYICKPPDNLGSQTSIFLNAGSA
ncbi:hypothetical protein FRC09_020122 [Ceratobasidium sp. 395]|nr:hypothetical protein FRC09_020122 [Ceratobasidium sp. 395]